MIAAIYARKSTEQTGVGDEAKSVTRQVEHARAYAERKGWTVAEASVYVDDGISGAEFVKRPGLLRLVASLKPAPPFQVLIMSEESRLGREAIETSYVLKQILDAGVRVFFYLEDRERTLDSAMDKVMLSLVNFAAEVEREKASQRVRDTMVRKARAKQVTGGKTYGYRNVEVLSPEPGPDGKPRRLHVTLHPDPEQAAVVRQIFGLYAEGLGSLAIAKRLNAERIPAPRPAGWHQTGIRAMLARELYNGRIVWGRTQGIMRGGTARSRLRAPEEWVRVEAPELRIVPDDLWQRVQARRARNGRTFPRTPAGRLLGRPSWWDGHSDHLLTGFSSCAICKGSIRIVHQKFGVPPKRWAVRKYGCSTNQNRGGAACANDVLVPEEVLDHALLDAIAELLEERLMDAAVDRALERLRTEQAPQLAKRAQIERELSLLEHRIQRGIDTFLDGQGEMPEVRGRLGEDKARKTALVEELEQLDSRASVASMDEGRLRRALKAKADDIKGLLGAHVVQGRQMLRRLLPEPLQIEPIIQGGRRGFRFRGRLVYDRLLTGEAAVLPNPRRGHDALRLIREFQVRVPPASSPPRRSTAPQPR